MNKKRKYARAAMTTLVLSLVVILVVNVILSVLSGRFNLKLDLTEGQILDFSETTEEVIANLEMDVEIISFIPDNEVDRSVLQIKEVLAKYDSLSERISYKTVDASVNPTALSKYQNNGQSLSGGDYYIVFESERMYDVVSYYDIVGEGLYRFNNSDVTIAGVLNAEQHFTSALVKVTEGSEINAYVCSGHGETFNAEIFSGIILPGLGYNFSDINLKTESIPEDADLVIVASPSVDYSFDEIEKIDRFLNSGGRVQFFVDAYTTGTMNLEAYLSEWNISIGNGVVCDNNPSNYVRENRRFVIPAIPENEVTKSYNMNQKNTQLVIPDSRPVYGKPANGIAVSEILVSGEEGFIKADITSEINTPSSGDEKVTAPMALMASKTVSDGKSAHLFVMGTTKFLGEYTENSSAYSNIIEGTSNRDFYSKIMAYMTNQPASFYIMPKNTTLQQVVIDQQTIYVYGLVTIVVIPVIILAFGFVVWTKRRHL